MHYLSVNILFRLLIIAVILITIYINQNFHGQFGLMAFIWIAIGIIISYKGWGSDPSKYINEMRKTKDPYNQPLIEKTIRINAQRITKEMKLSGAICVLIGEYIDVVYPIIH